MESSSSDKVQFDKNDFEVALSLDVENGEIAFPTALYDAAETEKIAVGQLMLEVRYVSSYLDLVLSLSKIRMKPQHDQYNALYKNVKKESQLQVAGIHIPNDFLNDFFFYLRKKCVSHNLYFLDFTLKVHLMYGPNPLRLTYNQTFQIYIGHVTGHISLSQLASFGNIDCHNRSFV